MDKPNQPIGAGRLIKTDDGAMIPSSVSINPARARALLWCAWMELNAIRARDGVPRDYTGCRSGVSEEYFSSLVDALAETLGIDCQPWPAKYMEPYIPSTPTIPGPP